MRDDGLDRVCVDCEIDISDRRAFTLRCHSCAKKHRRKRQTKYSRDRYANDPLFREDRKASARKAYHNGDYATRDRLRYQEDSDFADRKRLSSNQSAKSDKGKQRRSRTEHRRRAAKLNQSGVVSVGILDQRIVDQGGRCYWCSRKFGKNHKATIDHLIPLALGGMDEDVNLVASCGPCNYRKGAKHPLDFARQEGILL